MQMHATAIAAIDLSLSLKILQIILHTSAAIKKAKKTHLRKLYFKLSVIFGIILLVVATGIFDILYLGVYFFVFLSGIYGWISYTFLETVRASIMELKPSRDREEKVTQLSSVPYRENGSIGAIESSSQVSRK